MLLIEMVDDYCEQMEKSCRSVFESAFNRNMLKDKYSTMDLLFEVYNCQCHIRKITSELEELKKGLKNGTLDTD